MKATLSSRLKKIARRIILLVAPLAATRRTPQQLELFARPPVAAHTDKAGSRTKGRSRPKNGGNNHLASFI